MNVRLHKRQATDDLGGASLPKIARRDTPWQVSSSPVPTNPRIESVSLRVEQRGSSFVATKATAIAAAAGTIVQLLSSTIAHQPTNQPLAKARGERGALEQERGGGWGASSASVLEGGSEGKGRSPGAASGTRRRSRSAVRAISCLCAKVPPEGAGTDSSGLLPVVPR